MRKLLLHFLLFVTITGPSLSVTQPSRVAVFVTQDTYTYCFHLCLGSSETDREHCQGVMSLTGCYSYITMLLRHEAATYLVKLLPQD